MGNIWREIKCIQNKCGFNFKYFNVNVFFLKDCSVVSFFLTGKKPPKTHNHNYSNKTANNRMWTRQRVIEEGAFWSEGRRATWGWEQQGTDNHEESLALNIGMFRIPLWARLPFLEVGILKEITECMYLSILLYSKILIVRSLWQLSFTF